MSSVPKTYYTPEEYLAIERADEWKNEYTSGVIYPMSPANEAHCLITGNIVGELFMQLKGRPHEAFASRMRVKVSKTGMYT